MYLSKTPPLRTKLLASGGILARFLNVADGLEKQKRVLRLLELCCELQAMLPEVVQGRPLYRANDSNTLVYDVRENKRAYRVLIAINRLLERYRFRRAVPSSLFLYEGQGPVLEIPTYVVRPVPFAKSERGSTIEETGAVETLLDLAEQGALDRVRPCPVCEQWFMAQRPDQKYCRPECGRTQYRLQHKDDLKKYMRQYRKDKEEREQRKEKIWLNKGEKHVKK